MRCKGIFDFFAEPNRASLISLLWYYDGVRKTAMTEATDKPAILIVASQNGFINTPIHGGVNETALAADQSPLLRLRDSENC